MVDSEGSESVNLDVALVVEANHMCNKIWNAAKFVHSKPRVSNVSEKDFGPADRWLQGWQRKFVLCFSPVLLSGLMHQTSSRVAAAFASDKLYRATKELKSFLLLFCSHYIEHAKLHDSQVSRYLLHVGFDFFLVQLHPFMPFITDYLRESDSSVAEVKEDASLCLDVIERMMEPFEHVIALVSSVRSLKTRRKKPFHVLIGSSGSSEIDAVLTEYLPTIRKMCRLEEITTSWKTEGETLTLPVLGKLSVEVWPRNEAGDENVSRNKLAKLEETLARLDTKWCEERASEEARIRHHKTRQVLLQQISDLKK